MRILVIALVLAIVLVGCCGIGGNVTPPKPSGGVSDNTSGGAGDGGASDGSGNADGGANTSSGTDGSGGTSNTSGGSSGTGAGNNTPPDPEPGTDGGTSGGVAQTQQECATMTPDCTSCIKKLGCGWCKSRNGCFLGNAAGPTEADCVPGDWAVIASQCAAPAGNSTCGKQTNCASCLTGSGCKWCRQGSICVEADNAASCVGGWLTKTYQCAQTSAG